MFNDTQAQWSSVPLWFGSIIILANSFGWVLNVKQFGKIHQNIVLGASNAVTFSH
jgi:hypothetical protein